MSNGKRGRKAKPTNKEKDMIFTPGKHIILTFLKNNVIIAGCVDCHMNHLPFQCPRPVMTKKLPEWEKKSIGMGKLKNPLDSKGTIYSRPRKHITCLIIQFASQVH